MKFSFVLFALVAMALFIASVPAEAIRVTTNATSKIDDAEETKAATVVPRNIAQACRGVRVEACSDKKGDRIACLADSMSEITDAVCREWLSARALCIDDASRTAGGCHAGHHTSAKHYRRCIRHASPEELTGGCKHSAYYKSLFRHRPRRHRRKMH